MSDDDLDHPTIADTVASGDYRASLVAIRNMLAARIDGASPRQLIHVAPLTKQLTEVMALLEGLPDAGAPADDVESEQETVRRMLRAVQ